MDDANEDDLSDLPPTFELLDPKPTSKFVRLLVVVSYVLSVSMVAILLSIYYLFVWEEHITIKNVTESAVSNEIEILETSTDVYTKTYEDINTANLETVSIGSDHRRYLDQTDIPAQIQTSTGVSSFLPSEGKAATAYDRISETVSTTTIDGAVQEFGFEGALNNYSTTTSDEFNSSGASNESVSLHNLQVATAEFDLFNTNTTATNGSDLLI